MSKLDTRFKILTNTTKLIGELDKLGISGVASKYKIAYMSLYTWLKRNLQPKDFNKLTKASQKRNYDKRRMSKESLNNILKDENLVQVGSTLRSMRQSSGLTLKELAKLIKVSDKKLTAIENAKDSLTDDLASKIGNIIAEKLDLAYVAGLFDRKSSITITRISQKKKSKFSYPTSENYNYIPRVVFSTKHKILVDIILKIMGVGFYTYLKASKLHQFSAFSKNAETVLTKLYPYIKLKRPVIDEILKLRKLQNKTKGKAKQTEAYAKAKAKIWEESKKY